MGNGRWGRDFKELAHMIMGSGKSEILKSARHVGRLEILAKVHVAVLSPKAA